MDEEKKKRPDANWRNAVCIHLESLVIFPQRYIVYSCTEKSHADVAKYRKEDGGTVRGNRVYRESSLGGRATICENL